MSMRAWLVGGLGLVLLGFLLMLAWDLLREPPPALLEPDARTSVEPFAAGPRVTVLERDPAGSAPPGATPRAGVEGSGRELLPSRGGQRTRQHADGSVRDRVDLDLEGRPHGTYVAFHLDGAMAETGTFEHGEKQGTWRTFHESGAPREESTWDRGVQRGWASVWDAAGQLLRRSEMQGGLEGQSTSWYPDGRLESRGRYAGGKREGRWEYWLPTGELDPARSGIYQGDQRTGD